MPWEVVLVSAEWLDGFVKCKTIAQSQCTRIRELTIALTWLKRVENVDGCTMSLPSCGAMGASSGDMDGL